MAVLVETVQFSQGDEYRGLLNKGIQKQSDRFKRLDPLRTFFDSPYKVEMITT